MRSIIPEGFRDSLEGGNLSLRMDPRLREGDEKPVNLKPVVSSEFWFIQ